MEEMIKTTRRNEAVLVRDAQKWHTGETSAAKFTLISASVTTNKMKTKLLLLSI